MVNKKNIHNKATDQMQLSKQMSSSLFILKNGGIKKSGYSVL